MGGEDILNTGQLSVALICFLYAFESDKVTSKKWQRVTLQSLKGNGNLLHLDL